MAGPIDITPDRLAAEAAAFQHKLVAGLDTLREVDDVDYGATAKEEVWRDGKVVLYRYRVEGKPTVKVPPLISYALVNRPYMADLPAAKPIVRTLLRSEAHTSQPQTPMRISYAVSCLKQQTNHRISMNKP